MRKNFENWQHKEHEPLILSLSEENKSSLQIAKKLKKLYGIELKPNSFARLIRAFLTWNKTKQAQPIEEPVKVAKIEENKPIQRDTKPKRKQDNEVKTYLVAGCFHFPFHNIKLFDSFLKIINYLGDNLDGIVINGDYLDLMSLSSHAAGQNILPGIDLQVEYSSGLDGLLSIDKAITHSGVRKMFNWGNHEDRYKRHMNNSDNSKYGSALQSPTDGLKLHELGYEVNEDWKDGYFTLENKVDVFHGIYCNKYSAGKHLEMFQRSCVFNHTHRIQSYFSNGIAAFNGGTMAEINNKAFSYMPRSQKMQWENGFNVVRFDSGGNEYIQQLTARNNKFIFDGFVF